MIHSLFPVRLILYRYRGILFTTNAIEMVLENIQVNELSGVSRGFYKRLEIFSVRGFRPRYVDARNGGIGVILKNGNLREKKMVLGRG